jgi:HAD superfamily hydrolase (TIGR01509 family)
MRHDLPAAVLWDMDGTIVDTEPEWIAAERTLVEAHGGKWCDEDSANLVGSALPAAGEYIRLRGDLPMAAADVVDLLVDRLVSRLKQNITWQPGAVELLADLRAHAVPCALVTMSYRRLADVVVAALPPDSFEVTVTGDEVWRGKPDPGAYLLAAQQLGVDPADCIVIEDSPTGAMAGVAAGARVVGVPGTVPIDLDGVVTVPSLTGMDARALARAAR